MTNQADDSQETVGPLDAESTDRLRLAREWVKGHFTEDAERKYEPIEGKLRLISAILDNGWIEVGETWKLQALGVTLGDAIAQELLLEWVVVEDEFGRDPALNWPGTTVNCFPLTLISKRIERGETVNANALFEGVCADLREMAFSGRVL